MEVLEGLAVSVEEFGRRLALVREDDLGLATPCSEWCVRDLVGHVYRGNIGSKLLFDGLAWPEVISRIEPMPTSIVQVVDGYWTNATAMIEAFGAAGALDREVAHPIGAITGATFLDWRVGDIAVHAWDLARSLGGDEALDEALVEVAYVRVLPYMEQMQAVGAIGPAVPAGATAQERLLRSSGRTP